jgi:hypothetical protein
LAISYGQSDSVGTPWVATTFQTGQLAGSGGAE